MQKEPNRKHDCNFDVAVDGEFWNIHQRYDQPNGKPAWYIGNIYRNGTRFERMFAPDKIKRMMEYKDLTTNNEEKENENNY